MKKTTALIFTFALSLLGSQKSWAADLCFPEGESRFSGSIAPEIRLFESSAGQAEQHDGEIPSVAFDFTYEYQSNDGKQTIELNPFYRYDANDSDREHADLRTGYWMYEGDNWDVRVGVDRVFWGVTESNHLVDVINQTDLVESFDGEEKLGQPMVKLSTYQSWGTLRAFVLPGFRERTYPGPNGRLRGPLPVAVDSAQYEAGAKRRHIDTALRYENVFGDFDVGIAHFSGTSREPAFTTGIAADGSLVFVPTYNLMDQTSIDVQLTTESTLYKLEALTRETQGVRFEAYSAGLEYTFYSLFNTDMDLGLLLEYHYDNRPTSGLPTTFLDHDIFFGTRFTFNDVDDKQFLAGIIIDRYTKNRTFSIEYSQRIGANYKLEIEGILFAGAADSYAQALGRDDSLMLRLTRYF